MDDLGLLSGIIKSTGLAATIDRHFPTHGNWSGPSLGNTVAAWLMYILSEADHRLSHVEEWAAGRLKLLRVLLDAPGLEPKHLCDQHLEVALDCLEDEAVWHEMLCSHTSGLLRAYDVEIEEVRLDAMITQSFREVGGKFQRGHSKRRDPQQPQLKEMIAAAGAFALPVATEIVAGNRADDELYLDAARKARQAIGRRGLLYVGDSKMSSSGTRAGLHAEGDCYLTPLSLKQYPKEARRGALAGGPPREQMEEAWSEGDGDGGKKEPELKAYGFSDCRKVAHGGQEREERLFYVCSPSYRDAQSKGMERRLRSACEGLDDLLARKQGRRAIKYPDELAQRAEAILSKHQVGGFISLETGGTPHTRTVRGRGGGPGREETTYSLWLHHARLEDAIQSEQALMGWHVYATNRVGMSFGEAVCLYRSQYLIEHRFDQLLNRALHLQPLYVKLEGRACALIRLLVLAMQFVSLIEYQVRKALAADPSLPDLKGLYPGHPGRRTRKPTSMMILRAFKGVSLVFHEGPGGEPAVSLAGWGEDHEALLDLACLGADLYRTAAQSAERAERADAAPAA